MGAAPCQRRRRHVVMRRPVRPLRKKRPLSIQFPRNAVDLGHLQLFFVGKRRQNAGNALAGHAFAYAGRADHQQPVTPGSSYLRCPLYGLLTADIREIRRLDRKIVRLIPFRDEGF